METAAQKHYYTDIAADRARILEVPRMTYKNLIAGLFTRQFARLPLLEQVE